MSEAVQDDDQGASPTRINSPELRFEAARAVVWSVVIGLIALAVYIAQPLLVIFGAMVFAAMIDGGARLLGRVLPIARGLRVALVLLLTVGFFVWLGMFAGSQISREAAQLPQIVEEQFYNVLAWLRSQGVAIDRSQIADFSGSAMSGVSTITQAIGGLFGGLTSVALIVIIGLYVAFEPKLYERGVAWMMPKRRRKDFHITVDRMAYALRRLMAGRLVGMAFEGVFTYVLLAWVGPLVGVGAVPMAALLAILTGLLAFIPNLGAIISGVLIILVGFSGGVETGLYAMFVDFLVQNFDGYIIIPMIAKKTVDLAPALVLSAQLIMGILFGILGLFLADPLLAMLKVALERRAETHDAEDSAKAGDIASETAA